MSWIEIRAMFAQAPADWSPIIEVFRDFGIENTLEEEKVLSGCLVDVPGSDVRVEDLLSALKEAGADEVTAKPLEEINWEEAWKQFFHPRRVGQKVVIRPTWEDCETQPDDFVIVLDPGQAFGTGDHPTTRLCLELMEEIDLKGKRVADVGCGSGILSVAAVLMGAGSVDAVDIDPLAVEVAKENATLNQVEFNAVAGEGMLAFDADATFEVIVSNIISATLIRIAPDIAFGIEAGGDWVLSGVIEQNWPDVRAAAEKNGFSLVADRHEDGWVAARFKKTA